MPMTDDETNDISVSQTLRALGCHREADHLMHERMALMRAIVKANAAHDAAKEGLAEAVALLRTKHYECQDSWYSCPKSDEGCADDGAGTECNCGAQEAIDFLAKHKDEPRKSK